MKCIAIRYHWGQAYVSWVSHSLRQQATSAVQLRKPIYSWQLRRWRRNPSCFFLFAINSCCQSLLKSGFEGEWSIYQLKQGYVFIMLSSSSSTPERTTYYLQNVLIFDETVYLLKLTNVGLTSFRHSFSRC